MNTLSNWINLSVVAASSSLMAIGGMERKAASVLPAISLSLITFRRKSHTKHKTNKPTHISRKFISFLAFKKSKPDPDINISQPVPKPVAIIPPNHVVTQPPVESNPSHKSQTYHPQMTEAQISAMREAFDLVRSDHNGRVSPSDLGFLMRALGANPTQYEINSILAQEHLTSSFSFNKFIDVMSRHLRPEPEQCDTQLHELFKLLDPDKTGSDTVWMIRNILTSVGERLQPSEFDEWIRKVGVGSNDRIRYQELLRAISEIA